MMNSRAHHNSAKTTHNVVSTGKPLTVEEELEQISQQIPANYFDVEKNNDDGNASENVQPLPQQQQRASLLVGGRAPLVASTNVAGAKPVRPVALPRQVSALAHPGIHPAVRSNTPSVAPSHASASANSSSATVPQFDQEWLRSIPQAERQKVQTLHGMATSLLANNRAVQNQHDEVQLRLRRQLIEKEHLNKALVAERDRQKAELTDELKLKDAELERLQQKYRTLERETRIQQQQDGGNCAPPTAPRTKRAKLDHYEPPNDFNTPFHAEEVVATTDYRCGYEPVQNIINNKRGRGSDVAETGAEFVTSPVDVANRNDPVIVTRRKITMERGTSACTFASGSTSSPGASSSTASLTQCYLTLDDLRDGLSTVGGLAWLSRPVAHYYYQKDVFCHQRQRRPARTIVRKFNLTRLEPAHILAEILLKLHDPIYQPESKQTELAASLELCFYLPAQNRRSTAHFQPTGDLPLNGRERCFRLLLPVLEDHLRNYIGFILKFGVVFNQWMYNYRATISAYQKKLPNTRKATWSQMDRGEYDVDYDEEIEARERQALKKFGANSISAAVNVYRLNDHDIYDTMPEDEFDIFCNALAVDKSNDNESRNSKMHTPRQHTPMRPSLTGAAVEFLVSTRRNMTAALSLLNQLVEVWPEEVVAGLFNVADSSYYRLTGDEGEPLIFGTLNVATSCDFVEHLADLVRFDFSAAKAMPSLELNRPDERKFLWFRDLFTQLTLPVPNLCSLKLPQLLFSIIEMAAGPIIGRGIVNGKKYLQEQFFEPNCVAHALRLVARLCELSKCLSVTPKNSGFSPAAQQQPHPFKLLTLKYFTKDRCERLFDCKSHLVRMAFCRVVAQLLTMSPVIGSTMNLPTNHQHSIESPDASCMLSKFLKNLFVLNRADYRRPENVEIFSDLWRLVDVITMPEQQQHALTAFVGGEVARNSENACAKSNERVFPSCAMLFLKKSTDFLAKWLCYFVAFIDLPEAAKRKIALANNIRRNRLRRQNSKGIVANPKRPTNAPVVMARRISRHVIMAADGGRNSMLPNFLGTKTPAMGVQRYTYKMLCTYDFLLYLLLSDSSNNSAPFSNETKKRVLVALLDPLLFLVEILQQVKFEEMSRNSPSLSAAAASEGNQSSSLADCSPSNIEAIYYDVITKLIKACELYLPEKYRLYGTWSTVLTRADGDAAKLDVTANIFRMRHKKSAAAAPSTSTTTNAAEIVAAKQMPLLSEFKRITEAHKNMPQVPPPPRVQPVSLAASLCRQVPAAAQKPNVAAAVTSVRLKHGRVKFAPSWAVEEAYEPNPPIRRKGLNMEESLLQPLMAKFPVPPVQ